MDSSYFLQQRYWLNTELNKQNSLDFEKIPFGGVFDYQWLIKHITNKDFIFYSNWVGKLETFIIQYSSISESHKSFMDRLVNDYQSYKVVEDVMINDQILKDVRLLIHELPQDQKEVVKMRFFMKMSFKEIAEKTGVSINTSLGRMRYALINLRKLIDEKQLVLTHG